MQNQESKFRKYLETTVNILLVVVCLGLVGMLIKQYFIPSPTKIKSIALGDRISFPDLAWAEGQKSLLLFLQSGCQYCTKSGKFYGEISEKIANNPKIRIIAVFSEKDTRSENYLKDMGLQSLEARIANFAEIGIDGTPTLAIIDDKGIAESVWKGILSPSKELEVQRKLGFQVADDWFIEESELADLRKKEQKLSVIDIRNRDSYAKNHFADAKNIPADEISVRAVNELSPADTIVVYGTFDDEGENAQESLAKEGFRKVFILRYKIS